MYSFQTGLKYRILKPKNRGYFMRTKGVLVLVLFVLFFAMATGTGNALLTQFYERGCVVPYATYDGAGVDTVVGISIYTPVPGESIYWSFYDADGIELVSNSIPINAGQYVYSFSLATGAAGAHQGTVGFLIMTWDNDGVLNPAEPGTNLAGHAFLINMANNDAAVIPVVPLNVVDYNLAAPVTLLNPSNDPLDSMVYGQGGAAALESRYLFSPSGDPRTFIIVFTPLDAPNTLIADAYSATGAVQNGITVNTTHDKLNVINVQTVAPPAFTEGALVITNPPASPIGIQFQLLYWSVVGAEQTIVATER